MTRHLIHWQVLALRSTVGATVGISRLSQRNMPIDMKLGCSKIWQNLPSVPYQVKPLGLLHCDGRDMPTFTPTIVRMATVGNLKPSRSKIHQIWRTSFYIFVCVTLWTVALRRAIFKQKKGSATISSSLNYCSMGSSQSPSRDSVPLSYRGVYQCRWPPGIYFSTVNLIIFILSFCYIHVISGFWRYRHVRKYRDIYKKKLYTVYQVRYTNYCILQVLMKQQYNQTRQAKS
jgi:hypothetical protein